MTVRNERGMENTRKRKAQAAIEYLTMYGWAIFVILLVIGILLTVTRMLNTEHCIFKPSTFTCGDINPAATLDALGSVKMYLRMVNNQQNPIIISKVACIRGSRESKVDDFPSAWTALQGYTDPSPQPGENTVTVNPGGAIDFKGIPCYELPSSTSKSPLPIKMANGQLFNGIVVVKYRLYNDFSGVEREAVASVATTVNK